MIPIAKRLVSGLPELATGLSSDSLPHGVFQGFNQAVIAFVRRFSVEQAMSSRVNRVVAIDLLAFILLAGAAGVAAALALAGAALLLAGAPVPL